MTSNKVCFKIGDMKACLIANGNVLVKTGINNIGERN